MGEFIMKPEANGTEVRGPEMPLGGVTNLVTGSIGMKIQRDLMAGVTNKKDKTSSTKDALDTVSAKIADLPETTKKGVKIPKDLSERQNGILVELITKGTKGGKKKTIMNTIAELFGLEKEERSNLDKALEVTEIDQSEYIAKQQKLDIQYKQLRTFIEEYALKEMNLREEDIAALFKNDPMMDKDSKKYFEEMEKRGQLYQQFSQKMKYDADFDKLIDRARKIEKGGSDERFAEDVERFKKDFGAKNGLDDKSVIGSLNRLRKTDIAIGDQTLDIILKTMEKGTR